jgi:hypothetical protein
VPPLSEVTGLRAGVVPPTSKLLPAPLLILRNYYCYGALFAVLRGNTCFKCHVIVNFLSHALYHS